MKERELVVLIKLDKILDLNFLGDFKNGSEKTPQYHWAMTCCDNQFNTSQNLHNFENRDLIGIKKELKKQKLYAV